MRRAALLLNINKTTVARKVVYLAKKCGLKNKNFLDSFKSSPLSHILLDDLITIEHTKLKPLSVSIIIDHESYKILGTQVSQIPAFGLLAEKSVKNYGKRKSNHYKNLVRLFDKVKESISQTALFETDMHKTYPFVIKKFFPKAAHHQFQSVRGAVVGQGELKKQGHDPIFPINHTCAMLRANINRLLRKTWCTTKDPQMLQNHLDIYMHFHNTMLKA